MVHPKTRGGVCSADGGRSGCISASLWSSVPGGLPGWDKPAAHRETEYSSEAQKSRARGLWIPTLRCGRPVHCFWTVGLQKSGKADWHQNSRGFCLFPARVGRGSLQPPRKIVLVMDNLNIHFTPIHASWLNMVEIEIGILSRQCLSQTLSSFELMTRQVNAWALHRNATCSTVHWRFSASDARCKLRKLYPVIL